MKNQEQLTNFQKIPDKFPKSPKVTPNGPLGAPKEHLGNSLGANVELLFTIHTYDVYKHFKHYWGPLLVNIGW